MIRTTVLLATLRRTVAMPTLTLVLLVVAVMAVMVPQMAQCHPVLLRQALLLHRLDSGAFTH